MIKQRYCLWRPEWRACWLACLVALFWLAAVQAAPGGSSAPVNYQSKISKLQARIQTLKAQKGLSEQARQNAVKSYQQAISALQAASADRKQAEQLHQEAEQAPQEIKKAQQALAHLQPPPTLDKLDNLSVDELSKRADKLRSELANAQAQLSSLRDQLTRAAQRPDQVRHGLTEARAKLQSLGNGQLAGITHAGASRLQAESALTLARRDALNARIQRLQQELSGLDKHQRLLEAKRSLAEARVANLNESLARVQTELSRKQHASAESLKSQSQEQLSALRSSLAPISQAAERNVALTRQLSTITQQTEQLSQQQQNQRQRVDEIQRRLNLVQRQLEIGGGSVALGNVLRDQRRKLAHPTLPFVSPVASTQKLDISTAELKRFQLQQDRAQLSNPTVLAHHLADKAGVTLDPVERKSLVNLLEQRRSILERLIGAYGRYIDIGRDLNSLSKSYAQTWSSFNRLLDERLFWLPSFQPVGVDWPKRVLAVLPWMFDPAKWRAAAASFVAGVIALPLWACLGALVLVALVAIRPRLFKRLRKLGEPVGNVSRDTVWLTLRTCVITALLSLPGILIPMLVGYLTRHAPGASRFTQAAAAGVFQLGMLWLFIGPFANISRDDGLADRHFQWPPEARIGLYRTLRSVLAALIVPVLVISFTEAFDDDAKRETLGRAAFMLGEVSIAVFAWRILHPVTGVLANVMSAGKDQPWRLGYLWLPVGVGAPLALSVLSGLGYYYTALQLQSRFFYSVALLGGAVVVYSLIVRWLTVVERRIALVRARRKREEAREARATREAAAMSGDSAPDSLESLEIDLLQINEQTRGLIKVVIALIIGAGLWLIWSDTLPALQLLNKIDLWQYATRIDGQSQVTHVTLGALLLAITVGLVTALAGRNLPGFLEITLLRRFSLDPGSRYAMATLFQYAIVIFGLLIAVNFIGFHWSSIQWLIAALGVGLGFGLQEIFANFISGLVILFERPVRVGDTVTVGTLTGTVSRIRIRATTVTDWDNKEVVIPNKTFITGTVINWTLSDDIMRLVIKVGVAFSSDTALVEKLIYEAIQEEPAALDNPAPTVFLVGYGDSAILFEARVFHHELYNLLPLQHALYRRILAAFAENGIEIVFPQRDLHIRSIDERVTREFKDSGNKSRRLMRPKRPRRRDSGAIDQSPDGSDDNSPSVEGG